MWYFFNGDIVLVDTDPDSVTSFSGDMGLVNLNVNNGTIDHDNFYNYDPKTIFITSCNRNKHVKKRYAKK